MEHCHIAVVAETAFPLEDLVERAGEALRRLGQHNGQVQATPDERMVRYYASLGMLDRPVAWNGRQALYGVRHVLQLTTIKRLQAKGLTLARVQQVVIGASDERLRALERLTDDEAARLLT